MSILVLVGINFIAAVNYNEITNKFRWLMTVENPRGEVGTYLHYSTMAKVSKTNFLLFVGYTKQIDVFTLEFDYTLQSKSKSSQTVMKKTSIRNEDEMSSVASKKPTGLSPMKWGHQRIQGVELSEASEIGSPLMMSNKSKLKEMGPLTGQAIKRIASRFSKNVKKANTVLNPQKVPPLDLLEVAGPLNQLELLPSESANTPVALPIPSIPEDLEEVKKTPLEGPERETSKQASMRNSHIRFSLQPKSSGQSPDIIEEDEDYGNAFNSQVSSVKKRGFFGALPNPPVQSLMLQKSQLTECKELFNSSQGKPDGSNGSGGFGRLSQGGPTFEKPKPFVNDPDENGFSIDLEGEAAIESTSRQERPREDGLNFVYGSTYMENKKNNLKAPSENKSVFGSSPKSINPYRSDLVDLSCSRDSKNGSNN